MELSIETQGNCLVSHHSVHVVDELLPFFDNQPVNNLKKVYQLMIFN
jgi:hypothetical protein